MIYHITTIADWKAVKNKEYKPPSLANEGFIHCSTLDQIIDTANLYFKGKKDLLILCIDEKKLQNELKYEAPLTSKSSVRSKQLFPHIYGAIYKNEVFKTIRLHTDKTGHFFLPDEIAL